MTLTDYSFFLSILTCIRFIGGLVFLDFYFRYKNRRFLLLTLAFLFLSFGPAIQMFLPSLEVLLSEQNNLQIDSKLLFILSEAFMTISAFLFVIILVNYIVELKIKARTTVIATLIVLIIPFIFFPFLITFEESFYLAQIMDFLIIVFVMFFIIYHQKQYSAIAKNVPLFLFINIIIVLSNLLLTLIESPGGELELLTRIALSFITPFTFVHLEYNLLGNQKANLKDKYTHNLSQILQIASGRFFIISKSEMNEDIKKELENLHLDFNEINKLIALIRKI